MVTSTPANYRPVFDGDELQIGVGPAARRRFACATPRTAHELMPVLFRRPLDQHQVGFAFGETLSHLHHLWYQGQLTRERGADGVYRFGRA
jgi:hypothetical protein